MTNSSKIKLGLAVVLLGITGFTVNYLMKQIRLLVNTKFAFDKVLLNKINFSEIAITLWWKVDNLSDFNFTAENQVYDIYLNDKFVKKVGASESIEILAKGISRIPTFINFSTSELFNIGLTNVEDLLIKENRDNLKLKVKGTFTLKAAFFKFKEIPFTFEKRIGDF